MKGWKMKLIRWQKLGGKRSSSTAVASPINNNNININNNLNSCLKSLLDNDDSISLRRSESKESSSSVFGSSGDDSSSSVSADASSRHSIPSSNVADTDDHGPIAGSANSCTSKSANTTCGSSNSSNKSRTRKKKIVRFDVVKIRKYERTISNHPCCSSGPPIG